MINKTAVAFAVKGSRSYITNTKTKNKHYFKKISLIILFPVISRRVS